MSTPKVKLFYHAATNTCTYLIEDESTKACAVVDSALDYDISSGRIKSDHVESIASYIKENNLKLEWILETHIHADHLTGSAKFKELFPEAKTAMAASVISVQQTWKKIYNLPDSEFSADGSQFDHLFQNNEVFKIGSLEVKVFYTPGHTPACASYLIGDSVFTGDTVFMPSMGSARCDFPNGSAKQLYESSQKILSLPESTKQFVGHIYGEDAQQLHAESTIGEQKHTNKHFKDGITEQEYIEMREKRDKELDVPRLIIPSLQVNIRAGRLPTPDSNGVVYFKFPVNQF